MNALTHSYITVLGPSGALHQSYCSPSLGASTTGLDRLLTILRLHNKRYAGLHVPRIATEPPISKCSLSVRFGCFLRRPQHHVASQVPLLEDAAPNTERFHQ